MLSFDSPSFFFRIQIKSDRIIDQNGTVIANSGLTMIMVQMLKSNRLKTKSSIIHASISYMHTWLVEFYSDQLSDVI